MKRIFVALLFLLTLLFCGCNTHGEQSGLFSASRGNTDGNLHNLGLTVENGTAFSYVGSTEDFDLIYQSDGKGNAEKAVSGLKGYIRFLNYINGTYYFLGVTYRENGEAAEGIFSCNPGTDTKTCLYPLKQGQTVSYLAAADKLLFFALHEQETTELRAVNPAAKTEAVLFKSDYPLRDINLTDSGFYCIEGNRIITANRNGKNKAAVYTGKQPPIHLEVINGTLYFVLQEEKGDTLYALKEGAKKPKAIYTEAGVLINHLNTEGNNLYFSADRMSNGELSDATLFRYNTQTAEAEEITAVEDGYTGFEIADGMLVIHHEDDTLSTAAIPLPRQ